MPEKIITNKTYDFSSDQNTLLFTVSIDSNGSYQVSETRLTEEEAEEVN